MQFWIANTDVGWSSSLASIAPDEVNFWQPNAIQPIRLPFGAPWLFKLKVRDGGWIIGGARFAHYTTITLRFAWDAFGQRNGAASLLALADAVGRYSGRTIDVDVTEIGSSVLVEPTFLPRDLWIQPPADWSSNLTRGKSYDTEGGEGAAVWERYQLAIGALDAPAVVAASESITPPYGDPVLVRPRLGQGTFRVMITDAYERRCVVSGERTLPVLEAAHIKPYSLSGGHEVGNGLLLRSDLHTLFDRGYVTVTPDLSFRVSRTLRDEFENGRDYYALERREVRLPRAPYPPPSRENLEWHADTVFRG